MTARRLLPLASWLLILLLVAGCVPESDLERVAGNTDDDPGELTPIPDEDLPESPELQFRVLGVDLQRTAGRVSAEISLSAGSDARIEMAETPRVEWSDGEVTDGIPIPEGDVMITARRTDSEGVLEPVAVYLRDVTRVIGTDSNAEITAEEIVTELGTFPVLSIDSASRPPGWHLRFQAAGQRWVSQATVFHEARPRAVDGEDVSYTDDFQPVKSSLRFGPEFDDLEELLPMQAEVEIREAIPEVRVNL